MFPNAIILSLSSRCRFVKSRGPNVDDGVVAAGTLEIPIPNSTDHKPAWIVDGQQRTLALQRAKNRAFPIPVTAFVADTVDIQRDQFIRIMPKRRCSGTASIAPQASIPFAVSCSRARWAISTPATLAIRR